MTTTTKDLGRTDTTNMAVQPPAAPAPRPPLDVLLTGSRPLNDTSTHYILAATMPGSQLRLEITAYRDVARPLIRQLVETGGPLPWSMPADALDGRVGYDPIVVTAITTTPQEDTAS